MKTADLYIRVSTDEQAEKGFSIAHQEDVLRHYCLINSIQIKKVIYEDFPAKDFKRPAWSVLFNGYKLNKSTRPDTILFTQWGRFSRNISEAYLMIKKLGELGIIIQAVEQPLDMNIPENKIILAFYLVAPEVENDVRSQSVKANMHKARTLGRWMSGAPIGYCNKQSAIGEKYIAIQEPEATLIREAFEQVSQQLFSVRQVYQMTIEKGLICSLNNFWHLLRNPVYCGRILITRGKSISLTVEGKHENIISQSLFETVQSIINSKRIKSAGINKDLSNKMLPFRGFLYCPKCENRMTGSGSRGRTKRYFYYHCNCGFRVRADNVHNLFIEKVNSLCPDPGYRALFDIILKRNYKQSFFFGINKPASSDKED